MTLYGHRTTGLGTGRDTLEDHHRCLSISSVSLYQHPLPCTGSFPTLCQIPSRTRTQGECLGNSLTGLVLPLPQLPRGDGLILTLLTGSRAGPERKEEFPEQHSVLLAVIVVFGEWGRGRKCGWVGDLCLSSGGQEVTQVHGREGWGAVGGPLPAGGGERDPGSQ